MGTFTVSLNIDVDDSQHVKTQIDDIVLKTVPRSECVANAGAEICYRLPFEETESFPHIFDTLDAKKEEFNIKTYGISITTLEEVFLKIGQVEAGQHKQLEIEDEKDENAGTLQTQFPQPPFQLEEQSEFIIYFRHVFAICINGLNCLIAMCVRC